MYLASNTQAGWLCNLMPWMGKIIHYFTRNKAFVWSSGLFFLSCDPAGNQQFKLKCDTLNKEEDKVNSCNFD